MVFQSKLRILSVVALVVVVCAGDALAQRGRRGRGGGGRGMGESNLQLLGQGGIQSELELVDDQKEELEAMQGEMRTEMREMFMEMRDDFQGEDRAAAWSKAQEMMKKVAKKYDEKSNKILLPHQVDRLSQIRFQAESRRSGGATSGVLPESVIKKLNITEEQLAEMKAKAEEVRKRMEEKLAKIRKQAEAEVLSVLSKEQQAELKQLMGDAYKFEERQRGGRGARGGGRGGDRGARGGDRGGRDRGGRGRGGRDRGGDDKKEDKSDF